MGLSSAESWALTPREFQALEAVHQQHLFRWAVERSDFRNANFKRDDDTAWFPEDFINADKAAEKRVANKKQTLKDKMDLAKLNAMMLQPPDKETLPAWAKPEFHRFGGDNGRR